MKAGTIDIHLIAPGNGCHQTDISCLPSCEKIRAARFHYQEDATQWVACRAAVRRYLARATGLPPDRVPIELTEFGKPVLTAEFSHIHFNLAHCKNLALLAVSLDGPVGIDLEPQDRATDLIECTETFCHPSEIDELPDSESDRATRLLEIWTAKEALLKAIGTGFSHAPENVRIHFGDSEHTATSEQPLEGTDKQLIHRVVHPELESHCVHLSCPNTCAAIRIFEAAPVLSVHSHDVGLTATS